MDVAILCGGEGTRLRPLTYAVPKPLLPLGSKPILEITINRMREQGFTKFYLMVNYKADMIRSYFGSGSTFGVDIEYVSEKTKLGTAGPLYALKEKVSDPFIVMNADLLTRLDFNKLVRFHQTTKADLTVALKRFEKRLAYGLVEIDDGGTVISLKEKPTVSYLVNSGIYVVSRSALEIVPENTVFQMTDLIQKCLEQDLVVKGYEFTEAWQDIGRMDDYMRVLSDIQNGQDSDTEMVFE